MVCKTKFELLTDQRMALFLVLWGSQVNERPAHGAAKGLAAQFDINVTTINRIWRATKSKIDAHLNIVQNGAPINNGATINALINDVNFYESRCKLSGTPPKWDVRALQEAVKDIPLTDWQIFWQLVSMNLSVPKSTVQRLFKKGHFRHHTSALKAFLASTMA
jgi:hypothetical protein